MKFPWPRRKTPSVNAYAVFRDRALSVGRGEIGVAEPPSECPAWGIIMEMVVPNGMAVTLVTFADGSTSMYFGNGGGVIGGHSHENVREAAAALLGSANQLLRSMKPVREASMPTLGRVAFYARTDSGLLLADASESELKAGGHPLWPLFFAGHSLIAELRKVSESKEVEGG